MSQPAAAATTASASGESLLPDSTGLFTAAHLLWIVLFALAAIAVIVWGVRQKRIRRAGEREVEQHNAELSAAAPAAEPEPAPQPEATPIVAEPDVAPLGTSPAPLVTGGPADGPVTQLKGLGPKVADRLAEQGITTVGQIAALTDDDAAALDAKLGPFSGRMARDRWQEQARFLATGDKAGFEAVFGRL